MWRERDTGRRQLCEDGGEDWYDAATSQGMPVASSTCQRQGGILSKRFWREYGLDNTSLLDFLPQELLHSEFLLF